MNNNNNNNIMQKKLIDYKKLLINELYKPIRKNFKRRRVIQKGINDTWQADLIIFDDYVRENNGYRYLMTIIDIFSKKAWAVALKTKSGVEVTKAFASVLDKSGRTPRNLHTDQGLEFFNVNFQKLMKQKNINHYHTYSHLKASIVERFQRTFKTKLYKDMAYRSSHNWVKNFQHIIDVYNKTPHRGIGGLKPNEVTKSKEKLLLKTVYNSPKLYIKPKYEKGMFVRLAKYRRIFDKSYLANYTTEVFKIDKVHVTMPPTYSLLDINDEPIHGKFYEFEIQKVANPDVYLVEKVVKTKGDKALVKWLGFKTPTWIPISNIL